MSAVVIDFIEVLRKQLEAKKSSGASAVHRYDFDPARYVIFDKEPIDVRPVTVVSLAAAGSPDRLRCAPAKRSRRVETANG